MGETLWLSDWVTGGLTALLNCGLRRHCMYQCVVETSLLAFDSRPRTSQPPALLPTSPFPLCRLDKCLGKQCRQKCRQSSYLPFPPLDTIWGVWKACGKHVFLTRFFLHFSFAFWATLLAICGCNSGRGRGSNTQRLFYIPFDCTTNAAGQRFVGSVVHSYSGCFLSSV